MPLKAFAQRSMFDPETLAPGCVEPGTVPWLLTKLRDQLIPRFLQLEWRGAGDKGRDAWPAPMLLALHILRWVEPGGASRNGACRRAKTDLAWRAGMGLTASGDTPTEKTMREFEAWLMERSSGCDLPRYRVLHEGIVETVRLGLTTTRRLWMMDSTPMFCFGALRGTIRLLGEGLRGLLRRWARATKTGVNRIAQNWDVQWVLAKSIKGGLDVDWRDAGQRRDVVERLSRDVLRVVENVTDGLREVTSHHGNWLKVRCAALLKVISDDLDADEDGRLVVAERVTPDRIVSITDPAARSGRKTKSQPFKGFKLNLLGDLLSGLIVSVIVVPGNSGDAGPGEELLARARDLSIRLSRVLADTAYGGTSSRIAASLLGIELVAPPPPLATKSGDALRKNEFSVDFEGLTATCPGSITTEDHRRVIRSGEECSQFVWPVTTCTDCPLQPRCIPSWGPKRQSRGQSRKGRRLLLHPHEQVLREARSDWADQDLRALYRRRGEGERLVAALVRQGARQARAFGLEAAQLQAHAVAMAVNLKLLARLILEADAQPQPQPLPLFPSGLSP